MITQSVTVVEDWARGYDWVTPSGGVWGMFFCFLTVSFIAAVWNIITSTFVDKVLSPAAFLGLGDDPVYCVHGRAVLCAGHG